MNLLSHKNAIKLNKSNSSRIGNTNSSRIGNTNSSIIGNTNSSIIGNTNSSIIGNTNISNTNISNTNIGNTNSSRIVNTNSSRIVNTNSSRIVNHCHCHRCGWTIDIDLKRNTISEQFFNARGIPYTSAKASKDTDEKVGAEIHTKTDEKVGAEISAIKVDAEKNADTGVKAEKNANVDTKANANADADADANADANTNANTNADAKADADADAKVDANANADADADAELNILTYHKNVFIEMVKTFRENITMSDINNEISIYKNELSSTIYGNNYLLKDFKYEIDMTLLPILQIIFINNDIKKSLSESIIQEIQDILNDDDQLMLLLMEFSIFLKILQPFIYAAMRSINGCINKFLNVRIQSNDTEEELFMIYNNQNMVLYNIFFLFSKKIANGYSNLILTTEFLELTINKKIKNIMQISRDNKYKRINLHLFQCTQCSEISDNELAHCCPCGQTFCSKSCQIEAWGTWHKQLCPNRQLATRQCLGCMQYFSKENIFKCTRCMSAKYCSKECQRGDWVNHKQYCNAFIFDSK